MIELNELFFIQLVNFLIILLVLNLILYRPIRGIIKKRADLMAQGLDEAEKFSAEANKKMESYEERLKEARKEANEIRVGKKEAGQSEEQVLLDAAGNEAAEILREAKEKITKEKESALSSLKGKVDEFAQKAADKVLGQA
ncbi:MAG: ATP synthase F0 subunit B [Desulfonatronovibrionaceae bacterium]